MERVRLAELCASTSLFTDLGTGQPLEHGLRTCLIAMRLAEALDVSEEERRDVYYVTLLRFLGCTADSHELAGMGAGDERRILAGMAPVTMGSPREEVGQLLRLVGKGQPIPRRLRSLAEALSDPGGKERMLEAHCEVASRLAEEMGVPGEVSEALRVAYARWDGKGIPVGVAGEQIPLSMRVAIVARDLELWSREAGTDAAREVLARRRGRAYAPAVVDVALDVGPQQLRRCDDDLWDVVLSLEPAPAATVVGPDIRRALTALGDFADLKSPECSGHARRVARIAAQAAEARHLPGGEVETLTRAALVHDLGVVGVPAGACRSSGRLSSAEWEQVRLHPLWSQRILSRCAGLGSVAALAGSHHERLDTTGYPTGTGGDRDETWGLVACAELYEEACSGRWGHAPRPPAEVAKEMARLVTEGALPAGAAEAVLEAAGASVPVMMVPRPAGLTEREVDVLRLLAQGHTNRQIAEILSISVKTVGSHVEHIYGKAGVNSRAGATLFAMQHDLIA